MATSQQGRITWDEEAIAEHDLTRGTRMKIEEPDTPYHYPEPDEADEMETVFTQTADNAKKPALEDAVSVDKSWCSAQYCPIENSILCPQFASLQTKLEAEAAKQKDEKEDGDEDLTEKRKKESQEKFKKKMRDHYGGEYAAMLKARQMMDEDEDEEKQ